jgi:hypothetical protein
MRDAMRSIRLRLLLSLLVVLGLVLGWVSWSAYALARYSLEVRQNGIREMLQARYESAEREERERFDESLLHQAHALAGIARLQWRWPRLRFFALGCLTAVLDANAFATVPIWLGQDAYTPLALRLHWLVAPNLEISEEFFVEGEEELYYQFTFPNGEVLHYSPNLSEPWRLPTTWREQLRLLEPYYDEIQSPKGEPHAAGHGACAGKPLAVFPVERLASRTKRTFRTRATFRVSRTHSPPADARQAASRKLASFCGPISSATVYLRRQKYGSAGRKTGTTRPSAAMKAGGKAKPTPVRRCDLSGCFCC